jgi:hypothetical protein
MNKLLFSLSLLSTILLSSCSRYGSVSLNYPLNPKVVVPGNVHTIALVNRSLAAPKSKERLKNLAEAIYTGEVGGSDKNASEECLRGVFEEVRGKRAPQIVIPTKMKVYGTGSREIPAPLNWKSVQTLCDSTGAQALLCLESFDSNTDALVNTAANVIGDLISKRTNNPIPSQVNMNVISYWRLYYPATKSIVDEYRCVRNSSFQTNGIGTFILPPDALQHSAFSSGIEYISRLLPDYYRVTRLLYKRGVGSEAWEFKRAFRRAETANWKDASEIWQQLARSKNRINAGRACLNMAVCNEVLGNTEEALVWARKSYEDYRNKLGRDYTNILLERKRIGY